MRYFLRDYLTTEESERLGRFVIENPHGNWFQHPTWERVEGGSSLTRSVYFWAEEAGEIKASALVRRHRLPGLGWAKDTVDRGPVCADPDVLREAILELTRLLQAKRSVSLKLNPYWQQPAAAQVEADLAAMGFRPLPTGRGVHSTTLVIDLAPDEQDILRGFRRSTRRAIAKAEAMGVSVAPAKDELDIQAFCLLHKKMAVAKSLRPIDQDYLIRLWRELLIGEEHGIFHVARYQGEIIYGAISLKHGTRLVGAHAASEPQKFPKVPKCHLAYWRGIQWAKEQGCAVYDLGGYLPDAPEGSPLYNINRTKRGFSRKQVHLVREHERVFSPHRYRLLSWLQALRTQAYDAVAMNTDVQVGGTDQLFNLMAGRKLQEAFGQKPQIALTLPVLVGTDGHLRMGKSKGNYVGIDEPPEDKYGKTMSIPDSAMRNWFELVTRWMPDQINELLDTVERGDLHPMEAKKKLAWEIVSIFDGDEAADQAAAHFTLVHQERRLPEDMLSRVLTGPTNIVNIIHDAGFAPSKSQARRLVQQGAVKLDGERITDIETEIDVESEEEKVLQVGKRRFARLIRDE